MLVGYARVSTQDQDPSLQLYALKGAGSEKVYQEKASGAQRERPELLAALTYMRKGDTLVVWRLDRLARSIKQLIETVEGLGDKGIGFRSLTEAIDTTTSGGKLVFHIFAALAEFERGIIRERTIAGLVAARARGRKGGRPPALSASDLGAAKAMLRDPAITVGEVARRLGSCPPPSPGTCRGRGPWPRRVRHEPDLPRAARSGRRHGAVLHPAPGPDSVRRLGDSARVGPHRIARHGAGGVVQVKEGRAMFEAG
jgi:DNA invertase Pin-like site-specific DNA recombinase